MFSVAFVCLFVCLLPALLKTLLADFCENLNNLINMGVTSCHVGNLHSLSALVSSAHIFPMQYIYFIPSSVLYSLSLCTSRLLFSPSQLSLSSHAYPMHL